MRNLIIGLLFMVPLLVNAQEVTSRSKIKLKDGSELQVVITENVPGDYIKIKIQGGTETKIDYSKIESIKHKSFSYHSKFQLPRGFYTDGTINLLFGRSSVDSGPRIGLSFAFTANYRFNSFFSAGIGAEPSTLLVNGGNFYLPLYLHLSGAFAERRIAPIYFADAGWTFATDGSGNLSEVDGGWFIRPGIGVQIDQLIFKLGYQVQKITTTTEEAVWWRIGDTVITVEERILKNISFGATLTF